MFSPYIFRAHSVLIPCLFRVFTDTTDTTDTTMSIPQSLFDTLIQIAADQGVTGDNLSRLRDQYEFVFHAYSVNVEDVEEEDEEEEAEEEHEIIEIDDEESEESEEEDHEEDQEHQEDQEEDQEDQEDHEEDQEDHEEDEVESSSSSASSVSASKKRKEPSSQDESNHPGLRNIKRTMNEELRECVPCQGLLQEIVDAILDEDEEDDGPYDTESAKADLRVILSNHQLQHVQK